MRHITEELGSDLERKDLDKGGGIPHESKYAALCELYNDNTDEELGNISNGHLTGFLETSLVTGDEGRNYDKLEAQDFYHLLRYVEKKYSVKYVNFKLSGNHGDFENFVHGYVYLYYFY